MLLLLLLIRASVSKPICFGSSSNNCVDLTSFVATPAMRADFQHQCSLGGAGFQPWVCSVFAPDVADLFGPVPEVPDLAAVLLYVSGYAFMIDGPLRANNGTNVDPALQYATEMIASGLSVLRHNQTIQTSAAKRIGISYRGESNYAGAVCQYGNGSPSFELLNSSEVLWGFSSSSLSLQFAHSWPFNARSPRILVMARNVTNVDAGPALIWPLPALFQMEVTYPPGSEFQMLACERRMINGSSVALLYGYESISLGGRLSSKYESQLLADMQQEVIDADQGCFRYVCAYACAVAGSSPVSCDCFDARGRRPSRLRNPNALLTPATCARIPDQAMMFKAYDLEGLCVTADSDSSGARISTQYCDGSLLQAFYFDPRGYIVLNSTLTWSAPLCLNVWGSSTAPGSPVRLYPCLFAPVATNDRFTYFEYYSVVIATSMLPGKVCLDYGVPHQLNATLTISPCTNSNQQEFLPIPFDLALPYHAEPWV